MDIMERLLPANFLELLGGVLAIVAIFAGLGSLKFNLRVHLLKLLSIAFICALALFSNSVTTYFVAIFVIATAVTELDFLQNLAAIIRGNDGYFNYKKEALSRESKFGNLAADVAQADVVSSSGLDSAGERSTNSGPEEFAGSEAGNAKNDAETTPLEKVVVESSHEDIEVEAEKPDGVIALKSSDHRRAFGESDRFLGLSSTTERLRRVFDLENKAFDRLEVSYRTTIERGVRLVSKSGLQVELDGLISTRMIRHTIFEIKYLRSPRNFISWVKLVSSQLDRIRALYKEITNKDAVIHFVLILEDGVSLTERQTRELKGMNADDVSVFTAALLESKVE
ncbi:hypothetical protein ACVWZP_002457 [Pseudomonas sp. TE36184]